MPPHIRCKALRLSSAVLYEGVKDVLTAQVSATTVQAGQSVTFSGTVSPDHTGHVIYLERQNPHGSGFHVIQVGFIGAGSTYSIIHQLYVPGTKILRVYIPGGPENQGAASQPFSIQVTPAPASTLPPAEPPEPPVPAPVLPPVPTLAPPAPTLLESPPVLVVLLRHPSVTVRKEPAVCRA